VNYELCYESASIRASSVKKNIRSLINDISLIEFVNFRIIKLEPFLVNRVLRKSCVVTTMQASKVVGYCIQIVNDFFAITGKDIVAHIQRFNWEINFILKLFGTKQGVSGVAEAFEVDD
jgi:hypothetical protein